MDSVKDKYGKPQMRLMLPNANAAVVWVREYGLKKYPDADNWKGVDPADWNDACLRHLMKFANGEEFDMESGMPHLWHALCDLSYMVESLYDDALYENNYSLEERNCRSALGA